MTKLKILKVCFVLLLIVAIIIPFFGKFNHKSSHNSLILEGDLSKDNCFRNDEEHIYVFPQITYRCSFEDMILSLAEGDSKKEDAIKKFFPSFSGKGSYGSVYSINAFEKNYNFIYEFADSGLSAAGIDAEIYNRSFINSGIPHDVDLLPYNETQDYIYKLFSRFMSQYGRPAACNFKMKEDSDEASKLLNDALAKEAYAVWRLNGTAILVSAKSIYSEDQAEEPYCTTVRILVGLIISENTFDYYLHL